MNEARIPNMNLQGMFLLPTPKELRQELPHTPATLRTVRESRTTIERILDREDRRLLVIAGPCSIHDTGAGAEYARRLRRLAAEVADTLFLVMRVYFEKPRTVTGWKGLINDPHLDGSFHIGEGLRIARRFLLDLAALGVPAGTEALDPLVWPYLADGVAWTAIGARTAESQTHREMASGIPTPVGFKNTTDGGFEGAINGIRSALQPHRFLGVTDDGLPAVFAATGNPYPHIVLRGGATPNYDARHIRLCEEALAAAGLPPRIVVDCSHGNSGRDPARQGAVLRDVLGQMRDGNRSILGVMLESHLEGGRQDIPRDPAGLRADLSVTDPCLDWDTTERLVREAADVLAATRLQPEETAS